MGLRLLRALHILACASGCSALLLAQAPAPTSGQPGYTLHVSTRVVLTDVTVTDKNGNPVHDLDRSAFRISDNGKPQPIASFAEHTGAEQPPPPPVERPGVFSNNFLQHPPPAFDVLLLDITTIHITDQMYLVEQLNTFVQAMPASDLLAVYMRAGDSVVMLQDFTPDRALLRSAVDKAIPRLRQPGSWAASDLDTLEQMLTFLRPYPGRKNLIWFSGGSNLALLADATGFAAFVDMRPLYDELEATRIAVYPVDARGLTTESPLSMRLQHMMMEETAQATGGHAFYNSNGLKQIASRIVGDGDDFYTLTYSPHEQKLDNKWHRVKVEVEDRSYQLSYRRGYYDDGSNLAPPPEGIRAPLRTGGSAPHQRPDMLKPPIVFSATVLPWAEIQRPGPQAGVSTAAASPKRNETIYNVHFSLPAADLVQQSVDGRRQVTFGIGILGVNGLGAHVAQKAERVTVGIDPDKFRAHPDGRVGFDEQIDLKKGEQFLYILVWDEVSGRFGVVQAPINVPKPVK